MSARSVLDVIQFKNSSSEEFVVIVSLWDNKILIGLSAVQYGDIEALVSNEECQVIVDVLQRVAQTLEVNTNHIETHTLWLNFGVETVLVITSHQGEIALGFFSREESCNVWMDREAIGKLTDTLYCALQS